MISIIDDLIELGVHNWPSTNGRFADMYGPQRCELCGHKLSSAPWEATGGTYYWCDNYQCPRSWKFAAYLMGKWWPVDRVYATMEDFASTVKDAVDSVDTSWPDYSDPGTLM